MYNIGLIDEKDREYFKKVGKMETDAIKAKKYTAAFQIFDELLNGDLSGHPSYFFNVTGFKNYFNYAITKLPASFDFYADYVQGWLFIEIRFLSNKSEYYLMFQTSAVRKTIHVGNRTYNDGSTVEKHLVQDVMKSVKPWIEALLNAGHYRD